MEARISGLLGKHSTPALLIAVCKAHQKEAEEFVCKRGVGQGGSLLHIPGFLL